MNIRFGSVCSGIEAASVAFDPIGWKAAWFSEIEPFPCAVLANHYPTVPNFGDMTTIARRVLTGEAESTDVICGGTPCQAFSVAGLRESLSDDRGNLTLKFVEIADAIDHVRTMRGEQPAIIIWENVPGVLSTHDNAFGCFLAGLAGENEPLQPAGGKWTNAGCVYGPRRAIAWRALDAQYFGLAQRRRRVFVVASARDGFDPASVLFEWEGVRRDTPPSREEKKSASAGVVSGDEENCFDWMIFNGNARPDEMRFDPNTSSSLTRSQRPAIVGCITTRTGNAKDNFSVEAGHCVINDGRPRWLTPIECERLQGFPDNYTKIPFNGNTYADGHRYKSIGNSWAIPVVRWIGKRIDAEIKKKRGNE